MKTYHKNPRIITDEQEGDLRAWLIELGDLSGIIHDLNSDELIGGNQRGKVMDINSCEISIVDTLDEPDAQGTVARGFVIWQGSKYTYRQVRWTPEQCEKANIVANKAGGTWDWKKLSSAFDMNKLMDWGFSGEELKLGGFDFGEHKAQVDNNMPSPRDLPIDVIYTIQGADATCCLAVRAGLMYGIQSPRSSICPYCLRGDENHKVAFIDNDYFKYEHAGHLAYVKEFRPKYATVRDVMTPDQCRVENIAHYPLEQILEWAEELAEFAESVIVIPKYDCIEQIPEKFMLGYSIPTSHGGTPLPVDLFRGRRVHLLGGSWKKQLNFLAELGDDVVSLDNNYVQKVARYGQFFTQDGDSISLGDAGFGLLNNPRYASLVLTFGAMGAKVSAIYNQAVEEPANEEKNK